MNIATTNQNAIVNTTNLGREEGMAPETITGTRQIRVCYVHGTFAQGLDTEGMDDVLEALLKDDHITVKTEHYCWPKSKMMPFFNNSHRRRMIGARGLKESLGCEECAPTFVIAHSHGSAVSLSCLLSYEAEKETCPISGVVCVSAPFITVGKQKRNLADKILRGIAIGLTSVVAGILAGVASVALDGYWPVLVGLVAMAAVIAVFPVCKRLAKKHDEQLSWEGLKDLKSKIRLMGSAFDEAALYTTAWTQFLVFLSWSATVSGYLWVGIPLAMADLWILAQWDSGVSFPWTSAVVTIVGAVLAAQVLRWLLMLFSSIAAPQAKRRRVDAFLGVFPLAISVGALRLWGDAFGFSHATTSEESVVGMISRVGALGFVALAALTIMVLASFCVALVASTQLGVGVPFSTLLTRDVTIDKTVPEIDIYDGFSPKNETPIRHSRLLGWGPCQAEIAAFIRQRLVEEGFIK